MLTGAKTRPLTLSIPTIRNDFKVLAFDGVEAISTLYAIRIELVSEHPDFPIESLLCQSAFLQFGLSGEGLHGCIEDAQVDQTGTRLTHYRLTQVPALHYLQLSRDQRIFQRLTVPQIITRVLNGHGLQADVFTFHVRANPVREYCTQYDESDFEFVQRLCAEEGIAWHHQHSADGHVLVFTDDQVFAPTLRSVPFQADSGMVAEHPVVNRFQRRFNTRSSAVRRRDYDLNHPNRLVESRFSAEFTPALEDYRYPLSMGNEKRGKQLTRQALEGLRVDHEVAEGESDHPNLRSGYLFDLTEHPRQTCNDLWQLVRVHHVGKQPEVLEEALGSDVSAVDGFDHGYRNVFSAIPADVVYRPPTPARRPPLSARPPG